MTEQDFQDLKFKVEWCQAALMEIHAFIVPPDFPSALKIAEPATSELDMP